MSESLRMEVRPFGVRVVIIEPGDTKAPITHNRIVAADTETKRVTVPSRRSEAHRFRRAKWTGSGDCRSPTRLSARFFPQV